LRFYKLGEWSFWIDELYSIRRALTQTDLPEILARWPPISTLLMGATLRQWGVSEWTSRVVPALIGVLSIPLLYFPVRRMVGNRAALIAMLLLAVSPWHLFWSQNARYYTALMLLYALASLAFFFAIERNKPWLVVLFYALFIAAFRERFLIVFIVPVLVGYLLLVRWFPFERPPGLRPSAIVPLLAGAAALLLYDVYTALFRGYSQILAGPVLAYPEPAGNAVRLLTYTAYNIGVPLVVLAVVGGAACLSYRDRAPLFLLLGAIVPVSALLVISSFLFTDSRYAFVTLPSWILLAAVALDRLIRTTSGRGVLLAIAVLAAVVGDSLGTDLLYFRAYHGNRLDWKGAFAVAREHSYDGDVFVAGWPDFGPYYLGQDVQPWEGMAPTAVAESGRRHWFIVDSERVWTNEALRDWVERHSELVDVRYLRTPRDAWLRVYVYDPTRHPGRVTRAGLPSPPYAMK
jgi:mannosyltransferase